MANQTIPNTTSSHCKWPQEQENVGKIMPIPSFSSFENCFSFEYLLIIIFTRLSNQNET